MAQDVRPATADDLPEIIALYARVYPARAGASLERRTAYMRRVLVQHPWRTDRLPSLVYQDGKRVRGFLGVMPRPMLRQGKPILMAVSHHFMVDPACRSRLAGLSLVKAFLAGGQELSLCEPAQDSVRRIWEAFGGTTCLLQGLHWTRPLRPAGYLGVVLGSRGLPAPVVRALSPAAGLMDRLAARARWSPFQLAPRAQRAEELGLEALLAGIDELSKGYFLRPVYDAEALGWLLEVLDDKRRRWGRLQKKMVRDGAGGLLGYYLYYAGDGGVSQVLQVAARRGAIREVLDDLAHDAWSNGASALSGRLDPRYAEEVSGDAAYFTYGKNRLLIHTKDSDLERAIYKGDAFLTRLEGEWWIPLHG